MTGEQQIDYGGLVQDAMRGVVRAVLRRVAAAGHLPGEHHFYIAFDTRAPGVAVSKRLKQKYPEEMTVVLQHQFSDLVVSDERFEVTLSFGNVPERLIVPLNAVRVFFDPSVPYGLQFESSDLVGDTPSGEPAEARVADPEARLLAAHKALAEVKDTGGALPKPRAPRKPRGVRSDAAEDTTPAAAPVDGNAEPAGGSAGAMRLPSGRPRLVKSKPDEPANDSKVVQLDKFRKR